MTFDQQEFAIRFEWGEHGVSLLAPISDVVVIVDVLSFTTSVDIAVSRGAIVYPYRGPSEGAAVFAAEKNAALAGRTSSDSRYSLSPASLLAIQPGERLVLPSPNGSILSLAAPPTPVLAGCLRNAAAVASAAQRVGPRIAVIAAGERWRDDWSLRPSFEDLIGAGAIISYLAGSWSPEAMSAAAAFRAAAPRLAGLLAQCSSGKELIERGFAADVALAAQLNVSDGAPVLRDGGYQLATDPDRSTMNPTD